MVERTGAGERGEALVAGEVLGDQHEAPQRDGVDRGRNGGRGVRIGEQHADRAELVAGDVPGEAQDGQAVLPPRFQRHDGGGLAAPPGEPDRAAGPPCRSGATR